MLNSRWPRISWTSLRLRPRMIIHEAHVCRRSWKRKSVIFARRQACSNAVRTSPQAAVLPAEARPFLLLVGQIREHVVDRAVHRHLAAPTVLRLRELEHTAAEIDALPDELEDLVLAHAGIQRNGDDRQEVRVLGFGRGAEQAAISSSVRKRSRPS